MNEALQTIRVVHNFYEVTSENVQLICDLGRIEHDLQMQYYRFLQCLLENVSNVPTLYVLCYVLL